MDSLRMATWARLRRNETPPAPGALVLRGGECERAAIEQTARQNAEVYGFFGVSVFVETEEVGWRQIAGERLARASWLSIFTVHDLVLAGLELWDTGRSPHYDVVHDDLRELVSRLLGCPHRLVANPHAVPEEGDPA